MREPQPKTIHLKDYTPPAFRVETVDLDVDIQDDHALVRTKLAIKRLAPGNLVLDGDEVEPVSVSVDGRSARHEVTKERLTVYDAPERFTLETVSRIVPQKNTKLEGLYATKSTSVSCHRRSEDVPHIAIPATDSPLSASRGGVHLSKIIGQQAYSWRCGAPAPLPTPSGSPRSSRAFHWRRQSKPRSCRAARHSVRRRMSAGRCPALRCTSDGH